MAVVTYKSDSLGCTMEIDVDLCDGDGECVDICPAECFVMVDEKSTVPNIDECTECCACVEACPQSAIKHSSC
jgi:NAD-dependent dihydropyrimidine dehydrogenase PreA subunit